MDNLIGPGTKDCNLHMEPRYRYSIDGKDISDLLMKKRLDVLDQQEYLKSIHELL